jgi:hypothetical protein
MLAVRIEFALQHDVGRRNGVGVTSLDLTVAQRKRNAHDRLADCAVIDLHDAVGMTGRLRMDADEDEHSDDREKRPDHAASKSECSDYVTQPRLVHPSD